MDSADLDLEDLPPKALRKLIKSMLAKIGRMPDKGTSDSSRSDDEREALAKMHEETHGKPRHVPVTKEDLPFDLHNESEQDDGSETDEHTSRDNEDGGKRAPGRKPKRGEE